MRLGLPYAHALSLPVGEMLDLIAVEQVKTEGFIGKNPESEDDFWALLERR